MMDDSDTERQEPGSGSGKAVAAVFAAIALAIGLAWFYWPSILTRLDPAIASCASIVERSVLAPDTLKWRTADRYDHGEDASVGLRFSAQNRAGVPIRGTALCRWPTAGAAAAGAAPSAVMINGRELDRATIELWHALDD